MAAANEKTRVLVLGHSFVRRLREFAGQNHSGGPYDLNLGLSNICSIIFHGIGGRTVDLKNDLDKIRSAAPNIVVLELGSNDLCDKDSDPETIALSIVALAELLLTELSLRFIAVCEATACQNEPFVGYNERTALLNGHRHLRGSLRIIPTVKCWQHRGLINPTNNAVYAPDGIHLNDIGNKALYRSYRGAIFMGIVPSQAILS